MTRTELIKELIRLGKRLPDTDNMSSVIGLANTLFTKYEENKGTGDIVYILRTPGYLGNCLLWWAKGGKGYTPNISKANEFSLEEAKNIVANNRSHHIEIYPKGQLLQFSEPHLNSETGAPWRKCRIRD